jgi:hypothetical protein
MQAYHENQGQSSESGAGKAEAAKRIMQYIAAVSGSLSSAIQEIKAWFLPLRHYETTRTLAMASDGKYTQACCVDWCLGSVYDSSLVQSSIQHLLAASCRLCVSAFVARCLEELSRMTCFRWKPASSTRAMVVGGSYCGAREDPHVTLRWGFANNMISAMWKLGTEIPTYQRRMQIQTAITWMSAAIIIIT